MKRPSLIHIRAEEIESKNNIRLGEKVESIADGKWNVR
ncbi:hypothetical protein BALU111458_07110 [Bacillus luti]